MQSFDDFSSMLVPLPNENIDTDQIIPARFLKTTEKTGLGKVLFYDWRYDASGNPKPEFVLNDSKYSGATILLAGNNFGCGSSREHAPWALADFGFKTIISTAFADIFRNNCLKNGLLPVLVDKVIHQKLLSLTEMQPDAKITVELSHQVLRLPDGTSVAFPIDPFAKKCLMEGIDELGYLLRLSDKISAYEVSHGYA
jgi:3-isopropylmalate/(R)-2-methylmalate dehydratase small subunit